MRSSLFLSAVMVLFASEAFAGEALTGKQALPGTGESIASSGDSHSVAGSDESFGSRIIGFLSSSNTSEQSLASGSSSAVYIWPGSSRRGQGGDGSGAGGGGEGCGS